MIGNFHRLALSETPQNDFEKNFEIRNRREIAEGIESLLAKNVNYIIMKDFIVN